MATYYDLLGISPDSPQEEIARALDRFSVRLKQTGQWEQYQDQYRKIETTLLSPDLRIQYAMKNRLKSALSTAPPIGSPPSATAKMAAALSAPPASPPAGAPRKVQRWVLWAGAAVLLLGGVYSGWTLYERADQRVDDGVYLMDRGSGEQFGVVLEREEAHLFPGKADPVPAILVYSLEKKRAVWLGTEAAGIQYKQGERAPDALLEEGRRAAKAQTSFEPLR